MYWLKQGRRQIELRISQRRVELFSLLEIFNGKISLVGFVGLYAFVKLVARTKLIASGSSSGRTRARSPI